MAKNKKLNKAAQDVSAVRRSKHSTLLTVIFSIISLIWIYPLIVVTLNSFKKKAFIFKNPFGISRFPLTEGFDKWKKGIDQVFFGVRNYVNAWNKTGFPKAFCFSLFITVGSVIAIIICTSMAAWYIVRVKNKFTTLFYILCLFSMVVPFQMSCSRFPSSRTSCILEIRWELSLYTWDSEPVLQSSCLQAL